MCNALWLFAVHCALDILHEEYVCAVGFECVLILLASAVFVGWHYHQVKVFDSSPLKDARLMRYAAPNSSAR